MSPPSPRTDADPGGLPPTTVLSVVLAAALAVFLPGLLGDFVYDDRILVLENEALTRWAPLQWLGAGLWDGTPTPNEPPMYYRPLVVASLASDRLVFGLEPAAFRLHSLGWHLVATAALVRLLQRLALPLHAVLLGGLAFAVHPAQVEPVLFVAARNDLMAAALLLLAVLALDRDRLRPGHLAAGFLAVLAAGLSKESAALAPLVLALLAWARTGRPGRPAAHGVVLAALACVLGLRALAGVGAPPRAGASELLAVLPETLAAYARVLSWPVGLAPGLSLAWPPEVAWGAVLAVGVLVVATLVAGGRRAAAGWGVAGLALAPSLAAVAQTDLVPDRYLYLPLAGVALALAAAAARLPRRPALALAALLGLGLATLAARTVPTWADDVSLWRAGAARHENPHTWGALAKALEARGQLDEAAGWYRRATTTTPPLRHACWNVAALGITRADPAAAAADGEAALAAGCPPDPELLAPTALGHALTGAWAPAEARAAQVDRDPTGLAVIVRVAAAARRGDLGPFDAAAPTADQAGQLGPMVVRVLREAGEHDAAAAVEAHVAGR